MDLAKEQELNVKVIEKAWDDAEFKRELLANPVEAMEKLTGHKINLPEGQKLIVIDQTDESTIYLNIPRKIDVDSLQLTDEQLESVSGGFALTGLGLGIMAGIAIYAATREK